MTKKIWANILEEGEEIKYEFSVGKRYRLVRSLILYIPGILFLLGGFMLMFVSLWTGLVAIIGILLIAMGRFHYWYLRKINNFALTDRRVLHRKGWLSTKLITAEYKKITHVEVIQSFQDKIITNTGCLKIDTAGLAGTEIVFFHIEDPYLVRKKKEVAH